MTHVMLVICCWTENRKYSFYSHSLCSESYKQKFPNLVFIIIQKYWWILKGNARHEVKKHCWQRNRPPVKLSRLNTSMPNCVLWLTRAADIVNHHPKYRFYFQHNVWPRHLKSDLATGEYMDPFLHVPHWLIVKWISAVF